MRIYRLRDIISQSSWQILQGLGRQSVEFVKEITSEFPPLSAIIIEAELNCPTAADLCLPFFRRDGQLDYLKRKWHTEIIPPNCLQPELFKKLSNFINYSWGDANIQKIWLEFDNRSWVKGMFPIPGVFFNYDGHCDLLPIYTIAEDFGYFSPRFSDAIELFQVRYCDIGFFFGRATAITRLSVELCIDDFFQSASYLSLVLPFEFLVCLQKVMKYIDTDDVRVNLDIGDGDIKIQSIEIIADSQQYWPDILNILKDFGYCSVDDTKRLLSWSTDYQHVSPLPSESIPTLQCMPDFIARSISHIKLMASKEPVHKVYLCEEYIWTSAADV